jgi:2-dehydro-3-deoxy-D-arabinonate dehydratase
MLIVRYQTETPVPEVGVITEAGIHRLDISSMAELLRLPLREIQDLVSHACRTVPEHMTARLLPPVDELTEVWAAGVTYQDSRDARVEESERASTVYTDVYAADRPELFLKCASWRAVGDNDFVRVRSDGGVSVPEPELAVLGNAHREIVGFSVCNDMSSRSIEAANPLYLPQAKIYDGACALGPGIRPVWEVPDPHDLAIRAAIRRDGRVVWEAETSTAMLRRKVDELVDWLTREVSFPHGFALSTGTGIVPDWPFALQGGDTIVVDITGVGTLTNVVATP